MKKISKDIGYWLKRRLLCIPERDRWRASWFIMVCFLATTAAAVVTAIGNPTGAGTLTHIADIAKALGLNMLAFVVVTFVLALIFSLIYVPLPRLAAGSFVYAIALNVIILYEANSGTIFSWVIGISYVLATVLLGLMIMLVIRRRGARFPVIFLAILVVVGGIVYANLPYDDSSPQTMQVATNDTAATSIENPGKPGSYDVTFMTYGSGKDVQREAFGSKVGEVTSEVDASSFITKWSTKREDFWEFGPSNFPVNGRAWIPEAQSDAGPYPVVLMVHGNHTMEKFSTDGYDYLGEQFASRGFLAISVDEDFINYSNFTGQPNDNYKLRAWMLLQHLIQLKELNQSIDSDLYQKVDLENVALMGHSRGGQAAPMAADYDTFFDDQSLLKEMEDITIKAVAALAPTDKSIDDKKPSLHNISYIVLQGAKDADISDFRGDRQYYRTTYDSTDDGLKTSLYIAEANHTQFNTSWGSLDLSLPRGVFLNRSETMDARDQRQIAKVYVSAFLERVFHGELVYDKLFQDYRYGRDWLPNATLVNKYRDGSYQPMRRYDVAQEDVINADGFKHWEVTTPLDRGGTKRLDDALLLEWEETATYEVNLTQADLINATGNEATALTLTMANMSEDRTNIPKIEVELETTEGLSITLPLKHFMPLPPIIETNYTPFGIMDKTFREGKYEEDWEPVFQTIDISLETFEQGHPEFSREAINKMKLHFKSTSGKVLLEEIGVR